MGGPTDGIAFFGVGQVVRIAERVHAARVEQVVENWLSSTGNFSAWTSIF
jgi:hypothetical protein